MQNLQTRSQVRESAGRKYGYACQGVSTVKIDGKVTPPLAGELSAERKTTPAGATAARDSAQVQDQPAAESADVQVSALAVQLRQLGSQLRAGDAVDAAKVEAARQAIAQGRLQIDPQAIADKLLEITRELVRDDPDSKP
jgi:negative regulator of flagellin synthesis FlgM